MSSHLLCASCHARALHTLCTRTVDARIARLRKPLHAAGWKVITSRPHVIEGLGDKAFQARQCEEFLSCHVPVFIAFADQLSTVLDWDPVGVHFVSTFHFARKRHESTRRDALIWVRRYLRRRDKRTAAGQSMCKEIKSSLRAAARASATIVKTRCWRGS